MKYFLRFFIALILAMSWHYLGGSMEVALFFFVFIWGVLSITPIKFQDPKQREEYIEKLKRAKERRRELEEARLEEKRRLKEDGADREEKMRAEYEALKKKSLT